MIVIVGGGITGLSMAYFLKNKGYDIAVLEKNSQLGGNASWTKLGEFGVGAFYHVITSRDTNLLQLMRELGIEDRLFPIHAKIGFFQKGKLYPISTPREFLFFPPLSWSERFRLGMLIIQSKAIKDWHKLDGISASQWLSRAGGEGGYKKVWRPIMNTKFGPASNEIVATDMWFRINRLIDLPAGNSKSRVYSMKGGLKTLFDSLEKRLVQKGVKILKNSKIEKIKINKDQVAGVILNNREELPTDKIVSTIPLPDFRQILPGGYQEYDDNLARIRYLDNICLILRLKEQFSPYYQLNIAEGGFPFTGIIGADALYPPEDFGKGYVLYISKYLLKEDNLFNIDKVALLDYYMPYLKKIYPDFDKKLVLNISLTRKTNVEPLHSLNYAKLIPSFESPIKNLYLMCTAQIYPEPTVLNASVEYAGKLVERLF